jgi:hypothetical protein
MKKIITTLFVFLIACNISTFAIDLAKDLSGLKLPDNPLVAPAGKAIQKPQLNATDKMYILFDNLDPEISTQISNYYELMYYDIYKKWPAPDYNYYDLMVRAPYSDATLSQYNLTDFDVAIFPMGSYPLNVATSGGGIKVIDKIKEMLDAGKRVMIIGRYWVSYAFHPDGAFAAGKDPIAVDFLSNTIGIDGSKSGVISLVSGSNYIPYHIESVEGDPCAKGYDYYCNIGYGRNVPPDPPIAYRPLLDIFTLKNDANGIGFSFMDKYGNINGDPNVDPGIWVGVRAQVGDGRIAMWSLAPDNIAINESPFFVNCEQFAMDWFAKDLPKASQWIEFDASLLDFSETLLDNEKVREIRFRNFGKKPLTINSIYWNGWEEDGIFVVKEGGQKGVLQPGEFRTVKIGFTPTQEKDYEDQLFFDTDAVNGTTTAVNCKGRGGKNVAIGPEIKVQTEAFDFGTIDVPTAITKEVFFSSVGTAPVIVDNIEFYENDDNSFSFPQGMNFPQVVDGGKNYAFNVRFTPLIPGKTYNGTLKITSNAKKNFVAYLKLTGKSKSSAEGSSIASNLPKDTLNFGGVMPNESKTIEFSILSTGKESLRINLFYLKDDNDSYSIPDEIMNLKQYDIVPTASLVVPVTFTPWVDGDTYLAQFGMFTNAVNQGGSNFIVNFKGIGDDGVGVKDESQNKFGTLKLKAFPNPAKDNFTLQVTSQNIFLNSALNIYDLKGKIVSTIFKGNIETGTNNYELNSANLPSGQYFIGVQTATESVMLPFIIVK